MYKYHSISSPQSDKSLWYLGFDSVSPQDFLIFILQGKGFLCIAFLLSLQSLSLTNFFCECVYLFADFQFCRFYAAEIAVGLFFLHRKGIIYRWVSQRETSFMQWSTASASDSFIVKRKIDWTQAVYSKTFHDTSDERMLDRQIR